MEEDWFLYSITLFTFIVIFTFCYIRHVFTFFERSRIESASYPSFPFGNVYDVVFHKTPMFTVLWKFYNKLKRRNCKFGGFYIFLNPAIVIVDPKFAQKTVTSDNFDDAHFELKCGDFNEGLKSEILDAVLKHARKVLSKNTPFDKEEVNLTQILNNFFMDTVRECFTFKEKEQSATIWGASNFQKLIFLCWPQLRKLHRTNHQTIARFCEETLKYRKKNDEKVDDILRIFQENGVGLETVAHLMDTLKKSNNLVLFALYELSINAEIQDDLRGEIARFQKQKPITSVSELDELSYLETVVCETLRKFPLTPFVCRISLTDCVLDNAALSKNVAVFVSIFGIHHDPVNYTNPELFDPDRFSEENHKYIDSTKYLPFGYANNDFESAYVKLLIKLLLIELVSKYEFRLGKKSPKSLTFDERVFELKPKDDVWFAVKRVK